MTTLPYKHTIAKGAFIRNKVIPFEPNANPLCGPGPLIECPKRGKMRPAREGEERTNTDG